MDSEEVEMAVRIGAILLLAMVAWGCGGDDEPEASSTDGSTVVDDGAADDGSSSDETAGDEAAGDETTAENGARGSVSVAGATYEFTDVYECEVGGDFGPDWRSFGAWTDDGRVNITITLASGEDEWMTDFDLAVGLANPRTLDEGNPDEEWTSSTGGSVSPTLTDAGATGTADVTTLGPDGATDAVAEWSFAC